MAFSQSQDTSADESELSGFIRTCTTLSLPKQDRDEAIAKLVQYDDIEIVKELGTALLSNDSSVRRLAVSTLVSVLESREAVRAAVVPVVLRFLCSRLSDWASVEPSVKGVRLIYEKFFDPELIIDYESGSDEEHAKLRCDLSLFLGMANVSDLPTGTGSITEYVLSVLLVNVHAPSFGQSVRQEVLQLLLIWITRFRSHLCGIEEILVRGISIQGEDERDPDCLGLFFNCIENLFAYGYLESPCSERLTETLFEAVKSYFPINVTGDDDSLHQLDNLRESLKNCMVKFGIHSLEYLFPLLHDPSSGSQAHEIVCAIAPSLPNETISCLNRESAPFVDIWNAALSNLPTEYSTNILLQLAQERPDIVTSICESFPHYFPRTCCAIPPTIGAKIFSACGTHLEQTDLKNIPYLSIEAILSVLLDMDLMSNLDKLVPFIKDSELLSQLISLSDKNAPLFLSLCRNQFLPLLSWIDSQDTSSNKSIGAKIWSFCPVGIRPQLVLQFDSHFSDSKEFIDLVSCEEIGPICEWIEDESNVGFPKWYFFNCIGVVDRDESLSRLGPKAIGAIINELEDEQLAGEIYLQAFTISPLVIGFVNREAVIAKSLSSDSIAVFSLFNSTGMTKQDSSRCLCKFFMSLWNQEMGLLLKDIQDPTVWATVVLELLESRHMSEVVRAVDVSLSYDRANELMNRVSSRSSLLTWLPFIIANMLSVPTALSTIIRLLVEIRDQNFFLETVRELRVSGNEIFSIHPDLYQIKLVIRYLLLDTATVWSHKELNDMMTSACTLLEHEQVVIRFASAQLLSVISEVVATGKLVEFQQTVFSELQNRMDRETSRVVRRQLAVAITNWINVVR